MKEILLISQVFSPSENPEAVLSAKFSRCLASLGWNIKVITEGTFPVGSVAEEEPKIGQGSLQIVRTGSFQNWLPSQRIIRGLINHTLMKLGLPCRDYLWYPFGVKMGNKILENSRFDLIYSRSCGFSSNIIALNLKRLTGLPWVAHFSDPWLDSPLLPFNLLQYQVCKRLERAIIGESDAVVFVCEQAANLVMKKYPQVWRKKVKVIPHAYDSNEYLELEVKRGSGAPLRFVHAGTFYKGTRTPISLFQALAKLKKRCNLKNQIEFIMLGPLDQAYCENAKRLGVDEYIKWYGLKSRKDTFKICANADVLMVIDAPAKEESVFLPSKLVDYLPFKKPILGITPVRGASAELLSRLGWPVVDPLNVDGIAQTVEKFYDLWKGGKRWASAKDAQEQIDRYNIQEVIKELESVFDGILN